MRPLNLKTCPWLPTKKTAHLVAGLVWAAILLLSSGSTLAQNGNSEQIRAYLERNAEMLEWAHSLVTETENVPARRVLREALNLHEQSMGMMEQGRPMNSLSMARRSRAAIWRSVRLAREALSYEERIRMRGERFRDLHAHLQEMARDNNDQRAQEFIQRSQNQAGRAQEIYLQGDAKLAFKILEQAEQLLHRAARLLAEGVGPERLERQLESVANLMERTRETFDEDTDPAARNLLAEAEQALERARDHRDQGQPGRSLQMAGLARKLAVRAQVLAGNGPNGQTVQVQIERWDERAAVVSEKVSDSGSERARRHLEMARQHRLRAEQELAVGKADLALRQIRAAHDQLTQAEGLAR